MNAEDRPGSVVARLIRKFRETFVFPLTFNLLERSMEYQFPKDRRRMLKVKLKTLAAEARIIRKEERRARGALRDELAAHRLVVVRNEARATLLAYGFIRGRTLGQMEPRIRDFTLQVLALKRAEKLCKKYGPSEWALDRWTLIDSGLLSGSLGTKRARAA